MLEYLCFGYHRLFQKSSKRNRAIRFELEKFSEGSRETSIFEIIWFFEQNIDPNN
jgi:hypothetical protein